MVAKSDIPTAKQRIEDALARFTVGQASAKVYVFYTDWGHLRALIGSGGFSDMPLGERQEVVWDYLHEHVQPEHLIHLVAVHPMDLDEYNRSVMEA